MKNRIRIVVTTVLLLTASSAMAGIIFIPVGGRYLAPDLALVDIQNVDDETIRISTNGLTGELTIQGSDFPPEYDISTTAQAVLPFEQELDLIIDLAKGTVSGRSTALYSDFSNGELLGATAEVRGNATCLPLNGLECGQLVVALELQGVLSDPNDPSIVGQLRMVVLGSFFFDGSDVGFWAAMSTNTKFGGNEGLINSVSELVLAASA